MSRLRDLLAKAPRAAWACAAIALMNAAIWSVVIPPFMVPDEVPHFAYVQRLAETGTPPPQRPGDGPYSDEQNVALQWLGFNRVFGNTNERTISTAAAERDLREALAAHPSRRGPGGFSTASNQPPLYYGLAAIPYRLSPSHDILTRLALIRLLSALLAAGTVLCVFLFLRELLPGTPWAWTVGALAVAFQPMFMFVSSGVNADSLLYLASAATFLVLARAFRHGLSLRRGAWLGAAVAVGLLGKLTFVALLPGVVLALAYLLWRDRRSAVGGAFAASLIPLLGVGLYSFLNLVVWNRGGGATAGGSAAVTASGSLMERLSYILQELLPRLPFLKDQIPGVAPWDIWFKGFIGRFGWLDYSFPEWVTSIAGAIFLVVIVMAVAGAAGPMRRLGLRRSSWQLPLLIVFLAMVGGLAFVIGWQALPYRRQLGAPPFEQARYLFPLLCLYGLLLALAARGAGRRWGPVVGAGLVIVAMAHGLFAELLTIGRYYA